MTEEADFVATVATTRSAEPGQVLPLAGITREA